MRQAIAILDSGVGGLTVVKEVMRQLPQEKIIYFGDTARTPYGPRSADEIMMFTRQIVDYLLQFQPKMIVIACNTATAVALEDTRKRVSMPTVGVIHPGARAAIKTTRTGVIGVIGTEGTIKSGAYEEALRQISPDIQVLGLACPRLVSLVEQGNFSGENTLQVIRDSLAPLKDYPIDCLILGCTHYPFLSELIGQVMGPQVAIISSADETAREISAVLYHNEQLRSSDEVPVHQFFCSGDPVLFSKIAKQWLGSPMNVYPVVWQAPTII